MGEVKGSFEFETTSVSDQRHRHFANAGPQARLGFSLLWRVERCKMTRAELIIQLLKVAIGLAFGAYFVWWSLQVLDRLTPEYDAPTAVVARAS
jgi:hypothetical protein